ncbi:hypothetical protein JQC91_07390 [Jannaschia sp. Os4]|uniref:hypothetical protein n=1 Tax=Jannaschia sp. Os4 TaxID=2807617 RepID=UPI00193A80DF|nr:hypothetical protein [Jannaschia sp. Os4]MBM2576125.1 hypothetical protein [Jannaschia sp. Os4]
MIPRIPRRRGPEVPVWIVHPRGGGPSPDRYELVFDFAAWVEAIGRRGPAPRLVAWAGVAEMDRRGLAQSLRRAVASEFDAARLALEADADTVPVSALGALAGLAVQGASVLLRTNPVGLVVGTAITVGSLALGRRRPPEPDAARLEKRIARVQAATEAALPGLELRLHRDLYAHAWAGSEGGRLTGMDYDAWPVPLPVRRAMGEV